MKSLIMPPTIVKKLYVGKSMEDLENAHKLDLSIQSKNTAGLIGLADRIFRTADMYYTEKDEEKAFIQYSKFVELMIILKQKPDFQKYPYYIKLSMNVNTAVKRAEQLKESLEERYLYLDDGSCFENGDLNQFPQDKISKQKNSENSTVDILTTTDMERPIADSDVRKEVFTFVTKILQTYSEPVYYEYVRGHVAKASLAVRKYVASKLKGEKLLEYFKLRKNYFTVEGTDVVLNKKPPPKRTRGRSECVTSETSRGRKPSVKRDKSKSKRSQSCSSAVSDNTVESKCESITNADEKLEHEDFVNKFFFDLICRHEKVDIHSLEYDFFPKKVKRHLDLYYKRKVANYFAQFPDKYIIDDDWKVSFNLKFHKDSSVTAVSKTEETSTQQNGHMVQVKEQSPDCEVKEIQSTLLRTNAILFFIAILTKSPKPCFTVQQLSGYVSQAPKELKSHFKRNYKNIKSFFEEFSSIFLLDSCDEVTLTNLSSNLGAIYEDMSKVALKASVGDISFQVFKERAEVLNCKIKTFLDGHSGRPKENKDKAVSDALCNGSTVKMNENELNSRDKNSCKVEEKSVLENAQSTSGCSKNTAPIQEAKTAHQRSVGTQHEIHDLSKMKIDVEDAISHTLYTYQYYSMSAENIVFEVNGSLYLPSCEPFLGDNYFYEGDLKAEEYFKAGKKKVVKIIPTPCERHKKYYSESDQRDTTQLRKEFMDHVYKINDENTYRFLVMVDLLCLEMTEKDFDFTVSSEIGAIQHFIEVLNKPSRKTWSASNLYNTIDKANEEVALYIRKKYRIDNFISFFKKQPEFVVSGPIVNLCASYKDTFARRSKVFSVSLNRNSKWDLLKLYESSCYQNTLKEVVSLLNEVCIFLDSKFKAKLTKLEKIIKRFPICLDWIKALEGETIAKKTKLFLELFGIFEFPTGQYISLQQTYYNKELMAFFRNSVKNLNCPNPNSDLVTIFHEEGEQVIAEVGTEKIVLLKYYASKLCHFIKEDIKDQAPLYYHELAKIIPQDLISEFIKCGITTRNLINAILEDEQYFLKNCQINLKTAEDKPDVLENAADNVFSDNEKAITEEEASRRSDQLTLSENGSTDEQVKGSNSQVDCSNSALCESNSLGSSIPTCATETDNSNSFINNQHNPQSTLYTCVTHTTQNESDSLENTANNLCSDNDNVLSKATSGSSDKIVLSEAGSTKQIGDSNSHVNCADSALYESNSLNIPTPSIVKDTVNNLNTLIGDQFQSLIPTSETHTNQTLSAFPVKDSTEKINTAIKMNTGHSTDKVNCLTSKVPSLHQKEELNASIDEIGSLIALAQKHSIPKTEDLGHFDEEYGQNPVEANKPVSDFSCIKSHVSSPLNISEEEICGKAYVCLNYFNSLDSIKTKENYTSNDGSVDTSLSQFNATKSILKNQDEMEKYLELLKMDDVCTEDVANHNETYSDEKVLNQTTAISTVPNCPSSAIELSKEHKTTDVLASTKSEADCINDTAKEKVKKKRKKRKSITKLANTEHVSEEAGVPTQVAAEELHVIPSKCSLLGDTSSTTHKDRRASCGSNDDEKWNSHCCKENLEVNDNLKSTEDLSIPDNYPLQPISAEIVLLTTDSCIAVAEVNSRKKNIYFLKCVFTCDNHYCRSACFDLLKVGDMVSCFVPPTDIPKKMWIAFMVSKEDSRYFSEINSFNETIMKQSKESCANHDTCVPSKSVSTETKDLSVQLGCSINPMANEASQTNVSGDIKLCAITKDSMCQMKTSVDFASTQTLSEVCASDCQTETIDTCDKESQTSPVEFKEIANSVENSCQTNLTGEVKEIGNLTDTESQTISTGVVMITKYYHL